MATNQELRQASVRDVTGTAYTYADDWMALFEADGITSGTFNDRFLVWLNAALGASYDTLPDAMRAFAIDQGATSWNELGTFIVGARILLDDTSIAEDASVGDLVGNLSVVNGSGTYAFTITADPDSKFAIDGVDDTLLELGDTLDYETDTSHSVTIQADNGVDDPITRTFTITVTDVLDTFTADTTVLTADSNLITADAA